MSEMRLYDTQGDRLYLTQAERTAFLEFAKKQPPEIRTFAETMAYTGCRISEALELVPNRVELTENKIVFRSLKKRRTDVYRGVPVPPEYLDTLNVAHNIRQSQNSPKKAKALLWPFSRMTAYRHIINVMDGAGVKDGAHRSPKGLRHAFGVNAILQGVPLHILQKWLGHSQLKTTAIYADAMGEEETEIAKRMWN